MTVQVQTIKTGRFRDWSRLLAWGAFGTVTMGIIISPFLQNKLIDQRFSVSEDEPAQSDLIQYKPGLIGALRVDAKAKLPANRWVTYEIQILDEQGAVLTSGLKQAWREAGTWREGGESGTWDESDANAGFALKTKENQSQPIRVAIQVLEAGQSSGGDWAGPIDFTLKVHDGSIDIRYLWMGFFGTLVMAVLTGISARQTGKKVIDKTIEDSDIGDRAMLGGAKTLIQVQALITSDETTPRSLNVDLVIRNADGVAIHQKRTPVSVKLVYDDGELDRGMSEFREYFMLSPRDSYGFFVEVTPDRSVDRTRLIVKEKVQTLKAVEVTMFNDSR